ncbi:hypothetical protein [Rudaeicoccus suwonensis]|uniref:GlcNAc-PI de-N-acetylase n=1 Tax=Rudaeicoccus suwonensis TaxID=657409 RepID=A0A561E8S0_9MICO|nr:hypothetical protein [Rudaeicoccus suwonensis]TWE12001.1 hypothetical protein BKA23_0797 [Rudaeicoccus suwonensis]
MTHHAAAAAGPLGLSHSETLVLSPHLDDAWLSAAAVLQQGIAEVWTVFAGTPDPAQRSPWDLACGFADSDQTMAARLAEDATAFEGTELAVRRLPFVEGGYAGADRQRDLAQFADLLRQWLDAHPGGTVVAPVCAGVQVAPALWERLGLNDFRSRVVGSSGPEPELSTHVSAAPADAATTSRDGIRALAIQAVRTAMHADLQRRRRRAQRRGLAVNPDHVAVRDIALQVCAQPPATRVVFYEDLPYLWHQRGAAEAAAVARSRGLTLSELTVDVDVADKIARIGCYASQLAPLDAKGRLTSTDHVPSTETYWSSRPARTMQAR